MFDHFVWSVVAVPLIVLAAAYLLVDRLRPDLAARVFAWSTVSSGVAAGVDLISFGLKALAEIPAVAAFGGWSHQQVVADTAHVPWVSSLSLMWCVAAAVAVTAAWWRRRKALRAADWYAAELAGDSQVVVVPGAQVDAFALPSRPGRIVVTTAMRDTLAGDRYAAVIAHERCHLEQRHHDLVWLARLGAAVHPLLAPMVRHVEYLVERAADEAAADVLGNRREVARAIGTVALRAGGRVVPSGMLRLAARHGAVPRRVRALLSARLRARVLVAVPAVLAVSTIVWTGECVYDLQELLRAASLP